MRTLKSVLTKYSKLIGVTVDFSQVREAMKINSRMSEAAVSSEELIQRMATMEKKLQQVTAERDSLLEESKVGKTINYFTVLLSQVLDGFDKLLSYLCVVSNMATTEIFR